MQKTIKLIKVFVCKFVIMKRIFFGFYVSLLCNVFPVFAQQTDSIMLRNIADEILLHSEAYDNLRFLCKKIGPRLSGSINAAKAIEATVKMLKAAGADTVYLQPCIVPHWVRGAKELAYALLPGNKKYPLSVCAIGNTVSTKPGGIIAEVVEVKNMEALHNLKDAVKGKIVFFNIKMNPLYVETFRAYGEAGIARRIGPAEAAKYGAVGVMVRSLASNIDGYPHTGTTQYDDSVVKIPAIAISTKDAEWLSGALENNKKQKIYFKTNCKMLPDVQSYNVIGEITGTEKPWEIVTVGGHLDSWDLGEGAQDDGAGCVQSIEIMRAFKKMRLKPKRTVRVVLFMNEENGLRGGLAYAKHAKDFKERIIFALESDAGGFTPRGFCIQAKGEARSKLKSWLPLFYNYGVYFMADCYAGSDIGPLEPLGTVLAGLSPDSQRYFDLHHAPNDVFEAVSKRELDLGTVNMAALIWLVSEYGVL